MADYSTMTPKDIIAQCKREDGIAFEILDELIDRTPKDCNKGDIAYALFVILVHCLTEDGWSTDQLMSDVALHAASHDSYGPMQ